MIYLMIIFKAKTVQIQLKLQNTTSEHVFII